MSSLRVSIVAPVHIQPSEEWIVSVEKARGAHSVLIVDDSNGKVALPSSWHLYDYARQKEHLGEEYFEKFRQFHRSPPCKNFGIWRAWKDGADVIVVIDSDCNVPENFVEEHVRALEGTGDAWENPLEGTGWRSRGLPYHKRARPVDVHMGLWTNELDINGRDRVLHGVPPKMPLQTEHKIAHGVVPLSGMNLAFKRDVAPAMMFAPHFDHEEWKFRRHDDIWGGYVLQKIMQKLDTKVSYGGPFVFHDTIVDPARDAEDEEAMIAHEERFYDAVDRIFSRIKGSNYQELFRAFTEDAMRTFEDEHREFVPLLPAYQFWVDSFSRE